MDREQGYCGDEATWTISLRWLSPTCSYQSIIIHTQCYTTSQECGYATHSTFKWLCCIPLQPSRQQIEKYSGVLYSCIKSSQSED